MSLIRTFYDPFTDFDHLFDDAYTRRFYRHVATPSTAESARELFRPRMDLHEDPDGVNVTATFDLPGIKPDEVNIEIVQDRLTISGEASSTQERDESGYKLRERSWGKYSRTLMLPQGTKPSDVRAKMEHGLLNVTFPKAQPQQQPQRITIQ